jgi:hypothetical protein
VPEPGMQPKTVRFGQRAKEVIEREADRDGVSFSVYVREAALARAIYTIALRAGENGELAHKLQDLREELDGMGIDGMGVLELILARVDQAARSRAEPE